MDKVFDLSKEYGVVLEGGGAKGAYQIGVWKAFLECGLKIKGVSGVSVGALNGALICMDDYEEAESLWKRLTYSSVMNVNDEQMDKLMKRDLKAINLKELTKDTGKILSEGGIDINPLKKLIEEWVDEEKIRKSQIEFVFGTFLVSKLKEVEITAWEAESTNLKDYLLASAALPAFRNEKLHGMKYLDGGMFNNVPVDMLINRGYKDIIVIRIYGIGLEKPVKIPKDVNIIEIAPRINLGGILEFNPDKIKRNIEVGYYDAMRCLRTLKGKIYYIDNKLSEEACINELISVNEAAKMALLEYYKQDYSNSLVYNRKFLETVCPNIASALKLTKDWTYKELYIALLELCAKSLRIPKYRIYTEEELIDLIKDKYQLMTRKGFQFPVFHMLIIKMMIL
ncbi:patatin-like phospholipase family protein [Anaerocolumna sp. AGMB13025]|uniref:patatin-like phospholipase family protein n=1 Tax=Anaerocolumna sp. AGMB13025 TaxID=3039116 RepID=UPI00241D8692|nr:patatin-like phospholipase family protein [Anaerocolumna sp. AGMB13025]WFR57988.1 patatin-like phospholipase family protein [Anaerocolumna sp. AGMB13025]